MSKLLALLMLFATLLWALAGCEAKDPDEPNLKGQPNPNYPRPGVSMGGGGPPRPSGDQKGGDQKTDDSKMGGQKMDDHKEHEGKTDDSAKEGEKKEGEKGT